MKTNDTSRAVATIAEYKYHVSYFATLVFGRQSAAAASLNQVVTLSVERILEVGIRRVARNSGVDRNTVALIAHGEAVKPRTFRKIVKFIAERAK